jgi:iron complex transport system substrate-binding protein
MMARRRSLYLLPAALAMLGGLTACDDKPASQANPPSSVTGTASGVNAASVNGAPAIAGYPRMVTDARGKQITFSAPPRHIVSLMPSNTEILFALGKGDAVVMDTLSCDFPPEAKHKAHVDATKAAIEPILAQAPDLVVADDKYNNRLIPALEKAGVPILVVGIRNVAQIYDAIRMIGKATGADSNAEKLVGDMQAKIEKVRASVATANRKPSVLVMYSDNPIYTSGPDEFISEVIGIAGGVNVVTEPLRGNVITPEKVVELQPEVIIADADIQARARRIPGWADAVPAVQSHRFYSVGDSDPLVRPGPRLPQAVERLARFLHPELP